MPSLSLLDTAPFTADHLPRTPAELLDELRCHGPELSTGQTRFDPRHGDFLLVEARDGHDAPWVVRAPRHPRAVALARREARVLEMLGPRLPVRLPAWCVHTDRLYAYPRLPGTVARSSDEMDRASPSLQGHAGRAPMLLDDLAEFLCALQAIGDELLAQAGLASAVPDAARSEWEDRLREVRAVLSPRPSTWARWQRWLDDDGAWPLQTGLVHGQLHPRHLVLDARGGLGGVLDWRQAHSGDPGADLAMLYGCFGAPALTELLERVRRRGGRSWPGALQHARALWHAAPATLAQRGLHEHDDTLLAQAKQRLRQLEALD